MRPLEWQTVEIVLEGLSEKDDRKATTPGKLRRAQNVEFDKTNALNKRRGYTRVPTEALVGGGLAETLYVTVATYQQELVLYGLDSFGSVAAASAVVDDASVRRRGPTMRGSYRVVDVYCSPLAEDQSL